RSAAGERAGGNVTLVADGGTGFGGISDVNIQTGGSGKGANGSVTVIAGGTVGLPNTAVSGVSIQALGGSGLPGSVNISAATSQGIITFNHLGLRVFGGLK